MKIKVVTKNKVMPLCLLKAEYVIPQRRIYDVPIPLLKTKKHRIKYPYKPISKLFSHDIYE